MISLRRYTKFLYALPAFGLCMAIGVHSIASLRDGGSQQGAKQASMVQPSLSSMPALSNKPYSQQSYEEKRATEKKLGLHQEVSIYKASDKVYRGMDPAKSHCRNSGFFVATDLWSDDAVLRDIQDDIWRLRDTGVRLHAFFTSTDGQIPALFARLKHLDIPGGYGVITQSPAGMVFTPDRAESAQYWLAEVAKTNIQPNPNGSFIVVAEPLPGGC